MPTRRLVLMAVAIMALTALLWARIAQAAESTTDGYKTISLGDFETDLDGYKGKIVRDPTAARAWR